MDNGTPMPLPSFWSRVECFLRLYFVIPPAYGKSINNKINVLPFASLLTWEHSESVSSDNS